MNGTKANYFQNKSTLLEKGLVVIKVLRGEKKVHVLVFA